uniref:Secreted protein n=1 Tax=Trichuris muris TaxID=70415 RepID=A0A5S6QTT2_TRIMR
MWMFRVGSALVCFTSTETGSVQAPASLYTSWSNEASIDTEVQMEIVCHFQRDRGISTKVSSLTSYGSVANNTVKNGRRRSDKFGRVTNLV